MLLCVRTSVVIYYSPIPSPPHTHTHTHTHRKKKADIFNNIPFFPRTLLSIFLFCIFPRNQTAQAQQVAMLRCCFWTGRSYPESARLWKERKSKSIDCMSFYVLFLLFYKASFQRGVKCGWYIYERDIKGV